MGVTFYIGFNTVQLVIAQILAWDGSILPLKQQDAPYIFHQLLGQTKRMNLLLVLSS